MTSTSREVTGAALSFLKVEIWLFLVTAYFYFIFKRKYTILISFGNATNFVHSRFEGHRYFTNLNANLMTIGVRDNTSSSQVDKVRGKNCHRIDQNDGRLQETLPTEGPISSG